jgi:hypothetical protein
MKRREAVLLLIVGIAVIARSGMTYSGWCFKGLWDCICWVMSACGGQ